MAPTTMAVRSAPWKRSTGIDRRADDGAGFGVFLGELGDFGAQGGALGSVGNDHPETGLRIEPIVCQRFEHGLHKDLLEAVTLLAAHLLVDDDGEGMVGSEHRPHEIVAGRNERQ